jgi:hypothetical protein
MVPLLAHTQVRILRVRASSPLLIFQGFRPFEAFLANEFVAIGLRKEFAQSAENKYSGFVVPEEGAVVHVTSASPRSLLVFERRRFVRRR